MIHIGLRSVEKETVVDEYIRAHGCTKVFVLSPDRFAPPFTPIRMDEPEKECDGRRGIFVPYDRLQWYRWFYKLLAEIDNDTLVVVNECLRTQKRTGDLDANCIRNYLNQTQHVLVFQWLPFIESMDDFMTLLDWDTKSKWKHNTYRRELLSETCIIVHNTPPTLQRVDVLVDAKTRSAYAKERTMLFADVRGNVDKDPDVIPRNLLLISGKAKLSHVDPAKRYVGRNNRFKLPNVTTYKNMTGQEPYDILELPHNFIDLRDMFTTTEQNHANVLVADTKVDEWYWQRFSSWLERLHNAYATLCG